MAIEEDDFSNQQLDALSIEFLVNGILWVPYCALLFWCFLEHYWKRQHPQDFITLMLFLGSVCRCWWLFLSYAYLSNSSDNVTSLVLNRVAVLFQFTAISMLLIMWSRALTLSFRFDQSRLATLSPRKSTGNCQSLDAQQLTAARLDFRRKQFVWLVINILAWTTIIATICIYPDSNWWYSFNLILLCIISQLVNCGISAAGYSNWVRLRSQLTAMAQQPLDNASNSDVRSSEMTDNVDKEQMSCCCFSSFFVEMFCSNSQKANRVQVKVLRTLFIVSVTVTFFFVIRSFCFIYYPIVELTFNQNWHITQICFPFFYAIFPEFFPNLAIAWGISPPKGILTQWSLAISVFLYGEPGAPSRGWMYAANIYAMAEQYRPSLTSTSQGRFSRSEEESTGTKSDMSNMSSSIPSTHTCRSSNVSEMDSDVEMPRRDTLVNSNNNSSRWGEHGDDLENHRTLEDGKLDPTKVTEQEYQLRLAEAMSDYVYALNSFNTDTELAEEAVNKVLGDMASASLASSAGSKSHTIGNPLLQPSEPVSSATFNPALSTDVTDI